MRVISAPARALQRSRNFNYHTRLKVANGSGTLIDISFWLDTWSVECTPDAKVMSATFSLHRETVDFSLAPLMGGSTLNRKDDDSYSPLLAGGRFFTFETATVAPGAVPLDSDWIELIGGKIDKVNWQADPVTIEARDRGAYIQRVWIEEPKVYNEGEKVDIADQLTTLLSDNMSSPPALTVLGDPDAQVGGYTQEETNLLDALEAIAQKRAWDVRYKYNALQVSELTFYEVDRDKTVEDDYISPSEYFDVQTLSTSDSDVRTVVRVYYIDETDGETKFVQYPEEADVETDPAVVEFGRQFMKIGTEATKELIFDSVAATRLAVAAYKELSKPFADQEIICSFLWQIELGDLYKFIANNVHYDTDQKFFVVGFRHEGSLGHIETTVTTRGKPLSYKKKWYKLGKTGDFSKSPDILFVNDAVPIYDPEGLQKGWEIRGAVNEFTKSLSIQLDGDLTLIAVYPLGYQYIMPAGSDYRALTDTEKQFRIQIAESAGGEGKVTLVPRAEHSSTGGGGLAGPSYQQKLTRSPQTLLEVDETGDILRRALVFSVLPVNSILHYRTKSGSDDFTDWRDEELDANGKYIDPSIDVTNDVVVEFYSSSPNGVAENKQRLTVDSDNLPEFTLEDEESPANYIHILINPDDDVVAWKVWSREKGAAANFVAPTNPPWGYSIFGNETANGRPEPDDLYLKFDGTVNMKDIRFYAENGVYWTIVRVFDKYGNFQESQFLSLIGGTANTAGTISNLTATKVLPWPSGNVGKIGVTWAHNQEAEDNATKVIVKEDGVVVSETDRPTTKDYDDSDPGESLKGGWSRDIVLALDPTSSEAEFKQIEYTVEHYTSADVLLQTLKAKIGVWVQRTGDPGTDDGDPPDGPTSGDPDTGVPGTTAPYIHNQGPAFSAWIDWSTMGQPAGYDTKVEWQQSFNGGVDYDPIIGGTTIVAEGTSTHRKTGLNSLTLVRARVAWHNGAGDGAFSDWSSAVQVASTGPNEDF